MGAFNVFSVTRSKLLAIFVGVLDGLKGFAVPWFAVHILAASFWVGAVGMLGAILGHNYSVWLKFQGGRGLSTAAGGFFAVGVSYTIVWCLSWLLFNRWRKDIVTANVLSSIFTPILLVLLPTHWLEAMMFSQTDVDAYRSFAWILSVILLVSHIDVIRGFVKRQTLQTK